MEERARSSVSGGFDHIHANHEGERIPLFKVKKKHTLLIAIAVFVLEIPVGVVMPLYLGAFAAYIENNHGAGPSVAGYTTLFPAFVAANLGLFGWISYDIIYNEIHRVGPRGIRILRCMVLLAVALALYVFIAIMAAGYFFTFKIVGAYGGLPLF